MQYFYKKLLFQKPMLRQIEFGVRDGPITKNGILPAITLFCRTFCFSFSFQSWFHVPTTQTSRSIFFGKYWSFIWGCFFLVSILKHVNGRVVFWDDSFKIGCYPGTTTNDTIDYVRTAARKKSDHSVKSVLIQSYSGPNAVKYGPE